MVQTKRILFSVGLAAITLVISILIINPFNFDFKFTGLAIANRSSNDTEPMLESMAATLEENTTTSTTTVLTTTSTPATTVLTTTNSATTSPQTTSSSTTTTVPIANHIIFSEVFYDASDDSSEEWIELYNPTEDPIDISGFKIEDNSGSYTIPSGTILESEECLIIARDETGFENLYGFSPDLSGLSVRLNNDGDYLKLKNGSEEIDVVAWEDYISGWDLEADKDESIQRDPMDQDTDSCDDWIGHTIPHPDTGGLITTTSTTTSTSTTSSTTTLGTTTTTSTTTTPVTTSSTTTSTTTTTTSTTTTTPTTPPP